MANFDETWSIKIEKNLVNMLFWLKKTFTRQIIKILFQHYLIFLVNT